MSNNTGTGIRIRRIRIHRHVPQLLLCFPLWFWKLGDLFQTCLITVSKQTPIALLYWEVTRMTVCAEIRTVDGNFLNLNWQFLVPMTGMNRDLWYNNNISQRIIVLSLPISAREFTFISDDMITIMHVPSCRYLSSDHHGTPKCDSKHIHTDSIWTIETGNKRGEALHILRNWIHLLKNYHQAPSADMEQLFVLKNKYGIPLLASGSPMLHFGLTGY